MLGPEIRHSLGPFGVLSNLFGGGYRGRIGLGLTTGNPPLPHHEISLEQFLVLHIIYPSA